jgi:hypothetical protein
MEHPRSLVTFFVGCVFFGIGLILLRRGGTRQLKADRIAEHPHNSTSQPIGILTWLATAVSAVYIVLLGYRRCRRA